MTDLHELFDHASSDSVPPSIDELWVRGRQRRRRRHLARVAVPALILIAAGVGVFAAIGSRGGSELNTATDGAVTTPVHERVWVIPTFLEGPLEASEITVETPELPDHFASFEHSDDPDLGIVVFRQEVGVFEDSGTPVDINGIDGYLRVSPQTPVVDIEWRVDGLWQVFQILATSEADAIDTARQFQIAGSDALASLGWQEIEQPELQEGTTIISRKSGVLLFQDEPADTPPLATILAESNGFTVYAPEQTNSQLFVAYQGRLVFSYIPVDPTSAIEPAILAESLDIVTEEEWRAWLDTWTIIGSVEIDESQVGLAAGTWVNQLGLNQTDVTVWADRLRQACTEGVWDTDVALRLAEQYVNEDLELSARDPALGEPNTIEAAGALWTMSVQVCRDAFPAGTIEAGPPRAG